MCGVTRKAPLTGIRPAWRAAAAAVAAGPPGRSPDIQHGAKVAAMTSSANYRSNSAT
jgi:hypothetical protein